MRAQVAYLQGQRKHFTSFEHAEGVLTKIQAFDPVGVAARTLQECLLIQARHSGADDETLVRILTHHLSNLEKIAPVMVNLGDAGTFAQLYSALTSDSAANAWAAEAR